MHCAGLAGPSNKSGVVGGSQSPHYAVKVTSVRVSTSRRDIWPTGRRNKRHTIPPSPAINTSGLCVLDPWWEVAGAQWPSGQAHGGPTNRRTGVSTSPTCGLVVMDSVGSVFAAVNLGISTACL